MLTTRALRSAVGAVVGKSPVQTSAAVKLLRKAGVQVGSDSVHDAAETIGMLATILLGSPTIELAPGAHARLAGLQAPDLRPSLADFVHACLAREWMASLGASGLPILHSLTVSRSAPLAVAEVEIEGMVSEVVFGQAEALGFDTLAVIRRPAIEALGRLLGEHDIAAIVATKHGLPAGAVS